MVDIRHNKCIRCTIKNPSFNYKDEQTALSCSSCKLDDMNDIKHTKCIKCILKATFNYPDEKKDCSAVHANSMI